MIYEKELSFSRIKVRITKAGAVCRLIAEKTAKKKQGIVTCTAAFM